MKRVSNNLIGIFMLFLMGFSMLNTIFVSYYAEKKLYPTGKATSLGGDIQILVKEAPSAAKVTTSVEGGGGGGAGRTPQVHILDFIKKNFYSIAFFIQDKYVAIFPQSNYTFVSVGQKDKEAFLETSGLQFSVKIGELVKLDLDLDNIDDLSISFDGQNIVFISLHIPIPGPTSEPPRLSIEKIIQESGSRVPFVIGKRNYSWLLMILLVILIILFIWQYKRLRDLETAEEKKAVKIYKDYKSNKEASKKVFNPEREETMSKLSRQLQLLQNSHSAGYISKESYNKGKERINQILKKL